MPKQYLIIIKYKHYSSTIKCLNSGKYDLIPLRTILNTRAMIIRPPHVGVDLNSNNIQCHSLHLLVSASLLG